MRTVLLASAAILIATSAPSFAHDYVSCDRTFSGPAFGRIGAYYPNPRLAYDRMGGWRPYRREAHDYDFWHDEPHGWNFWH